MIRVSGLRYVSKEGRVITFLCENKVKYKLKLPRGFTPAKNFIVKSLVPVRPDNKGAYQGKIDNYLNGVSKYDLIFNEHGKLHFICVCEVWV